MIDKARLQAVMDDMIVRGHTPSVSLTIYDNGTVTSLSAGLRDREQNAAADENTMYAIGSSTKAFVSAALCILCDDGKLTLDDPVVKHIPEFRMYDDYVTTHLTVRDILCHRCGMPRHEFTWYPRMESLTPAELVRRIRYLKPNAPFRYTMQYQNHMFLLAGYLVERVSGQKWEEFVRERIFTPLGMDPVNFNAARDMAGYALAARPYAYDEEKDEISRIPYKDIEVMGAAGSINASTAQMAKWVALHLNNGKAGDKQIISEHMIRECRTPQMVISQDATAPVFGDMKKQSAYGLGWFTENYRGHFLVHHGGNIDGFSAMQGFLPDAGLGFSILTNLNGSSVRDALMYELIDQYFGHEQVDWLGKYLSFMDEMMKPVKEKLAKELENSPKDAHPTFALSEAEGVYDHPGYGDIKLTAREDGLFLQFGSIACTMTPLGYNHFRILFPELGMPFQAYFETSADNKPTALCIDFEPSIGEYIRFVRS